MVSRIKLGNSTLDVSRIALGCMRLSQDPRQAIKTIHTAVDSGINFFDHADIYGGGEREDVFSHWWDKESNLRSQVILQSKCGIRFPGEPNHSSPGRYDFSFEHIIKSVEGSLKRLKTDYLDVLLLHRPDPLVDPEEVAQAFDKLKQAGKVRWFGVSNHTTTQIQLLQSALDLPLVANQLQLSIIHHQLINDGVVFNTNDMGVMSRSEGTLEFCRLENITIQAWSPLAGGVVSGKTLESPDARITAVSKLVAAMAEEKNISKEAILTAWLLRHPAKIQPIIGTTTPERIRSACQADQIQLSREEWYRLFTAGRGGRVP